MRKTTAILATLGLAVASAAVITGGPASASGPCAPGYTWKNYQCVPNTPSGGHPKPHTWIHVGPSNGQRCAVAGHFRAWTKKARPYTLKLRMTQAGQPAIKAHKSGSTNAGKVTDVQVVKRHSFLGSGQTVEVKATATLNGKSYTSHKTLDSHNCGTG